MSRLVLEVSSEQLQIIKALAATEGKSIRDFVLGRVLPKPDGGEAAAWAELKHILAERQRAASETGTSATPVSQLTEETLKGHGKS